MAGACAWQIMQLDCDPEFSGKQNVVSTIYWRRFTIDGEHNADTYGVQKISWSSGAPFIPYDQLTKAQVEAWLEDVMGSDKVAALDANLNRQIEEIKNPSVVSPALPWA